MGDVDDGLIAAAVREVGTTGWLSAESSNMI